MIHPTRPLARVVLLLAATIDLSGVAFAQEIPEGQSCGGLVCDLGLFGHKVAPAVAPAPVATQPLQVPTPPAVRAEPRSQASVEPRKSNAHKKAHLAKALAAPTSRPAPAAVLGAPPVAAALATPEAVTPTAAARVPVAPVARASVHPPAAPASAPRPVATTSLSPPVASRAPSPIDAVLGPQPEAVSLTPVPAGRPAPPPPEQGIVLANPYVTAHPGPIRFQSVDPTVR